MNCDESPETTKRSSNEDLARCLRDEARDDNPLHVDERDAIRLFEMTKGNNQGDERVEGSRARGPLEFLEAEAILELHVGPFVPPFHASAHLLKERKLGEGAGVHYVLAV